MSRVDLRKQSLKTVYATIGPGDPQGWPIRNINTMFEAIERWCGVKLYVRQGNGIWELIGYGEKPEQSRWHEDQDDELDNDE